MDNKNVKILVVDDEPDILEFLKYNLDKEGYNTITSPNGLDAIQKAAVEIPDIIILDIMMPNMDGVQTCHELKRNPDLRSTLIAFLTARNEEYSEIAGLDAGADDYIQKPIRPRLLLSRVNALLRRKNSSAEEIQYLIQLGDLTIDKDKVEVKIGETNVPLAKKEYEILLLLISKPGKVFSRDEIFRKVWGYSVQINSRTIDVHISKLREKLGGGYIKTLKGMGYKLDI